MIEPQHVVNIGGVERRLRFRIPDWFHAERISGVGIRSGYGIPITTPSQMLPMLLLVGLNHEIPGLTLDKAVEFIDFENEDYLFEACLKAVYDYDPASKKKLQALEAGSRAIGKPNQELSMLIELILSITTTESGPLQNITAISTKKKSKT